MSSENEKVIRNLALFVYKAFQLCTKVINNAVVCLGPWSGGFGDGGGCLEWVVQVLRGRSRGALWCGWGFGGCV